MTLPYHVVELSSWDGDCEAHEAINSYYLFFYRKVRQPIVAIKTKTLFFGEKLKKQTNENLASEMESLVKHILFPAWK